MSDALKCTWTGKSGTQYIYEIHPIGTKFREVPGNYIFAKESQPGYWSSRYIGQTNNLEKRIKEHKNKTSKSAKYIRYFPSFELVYHEKYPTRKKAMRREAQLKKWSRTKKEALLTKL